MKEYNHKEIEPKWQKQWEKDGANKTSTDVSKPKYYVLDMFPYPSGAGLHVGHPKGYIASDIVARKKRMEGSRVLHPMGWDAFGLPAENYAIKTGTPPQQTTDESIATFKSQISNLALSYDWEREIGSHRPDYYRWTQWLFTKFFEKGLVYKKKALVNWDPVDQTVLANEQVLPDGTAERSGAVVEKKDLEQWFYKITDYADELADSLDTIDWPESTKINQRNWIGRSEGAEIDFPLSIERMKRVILLHGKGGRPDSDFMQWARGVLEKRGYEVQIPALPNSSEPDDVEQADYIAKNCTLDDTTIVIGHSAGGLAAMRLLESHKIGRLTLVATPHAAVFKDGKERPTIARSIARGYNFEKIRSNVAQGIIALYDTKDGVVPVSDGGAYAEKLGCLLMKVEAVKSHFCGAQEPDVLMAATPTIRVFTTRADTLFGATYLVLSPEHQWVTLALGHKTVLQNNDEVAAYVEAAKKKSEIDRTNADKEKTGVLLKGVTAINPATGESIPVYIADYVLAQYGTGAIMAVPAHDERDHAFAVKYGLPIKQVVEPIFRDSHDSPAKPDLPFQKRDAVCVIVRNPKDNTYLTIKWKNGIHMQGLVTGGVDDGEDVATAAIREVQEETGYKNLKLVRVPDFAINTLFFHRVKQVNRWARFRFVILELENEERIAVSEEEDQLHEVLWMQRNALLNWFSVVEGDIALNLIDDPSYMYAGEGILLNSGEFDGMDSLEARKQLTEKFGRVKRTYKLRDWLISRQRYWGSPIPIVYDPEGKPHAIPEEHLPWLLPTDVEYLPKGTSPLGSSKELLERTEKIFGKGWKPEIDTMDTFACSSWYFFRFADPHNDKEFTSAEAFRDWLPVDLYIGGAEHTVLHLLYARFYTKGLRDLGYLNFDEPFLKLRHQGLIVAEDGRKMSKRYGNVINPDDIVEKYGADTLRVYEMFMGPFQDSIAWNTQSMVGSRRFLEKVWRLFERIQTDANDVSVESLLHCTIKKVGEDIDGFKFNTAISSLMIFINEAEKKSVNASQYGRFLQLLASFAPHIAEERWHDLGHVDSILSNTWPAYDESELEGDTLTIAIQINGRTRATAEVPVGASKDETESAAREVIADRLQGKTVSRVVVVPKKLVSFVVSE